MRFADRFPNSRREMKQRPTKRIVEMREDTARKRFFSKIEKKPNGCWEWQGYRSPEGYGKFKFKGETLAHRVSFRLHGLPLFSKACILHRCDNPPCVNPNHLFLGTRDTNNKDRATKGRTVIYNSSKIVCKRGHPFNEKNTYYRSGGQRMCRVCACIYQRERNRG
jgi:hypothetical protein